MYLLCVGRVVDRVTSKAILSTNSSDAGQGTTSQKVSRWNSDVIVTYYYYYYVVVAVVVVVVSSNKCEALDVE